MDEFSLDLTKNKIYSGCRDNFLVTDILEVPVYIYLGEKVLGQLEVLHLVMLFSKQTQRNEDLTFLHFIPYRKQRNFYLLVTLIIRQLPLIPTGVAQKSDPNVKSIATTTLATLTDSILG